MKFKTTIISIHLLTSKLGNKLYEQKQNHCFKSLIIYAFLSSQTVHHQTLNPPSAV